MILDCLVGRNESEEEAERGQHTVVKKKLEGQGISRFYFWGARSRVQTEKGKEGFRTHQ